MKIQQKDNSFNKDFEYHAFLTPNSKGGMQTGIITRIDPSQLDTGKANIKLIDLNVHSIDFKQLRIFRAEFDIDAKGHKLIIYGLHLPASTKWDKATEREKISQEINRLAAVDADNTKHYVIITGDMNTFDGEIKVDAETKPIANSKKIFDTAVDAFMTPKLKGYSVKDKSGGGIILSAEKGKI